MYLCRTHVARLKPVAATEKRRRHRRGPAAGNHFLIHAYPCKMPHNNNSLPLSLSLSCSRPCTSWSVEIPHISVLPPSAVSRPLGGLRSGLYQLEQAGREKKMRGGVEECSRTVMLQRHHTSHCPFEWNCYPYRLHPSSTQYPPTEP